MNITNVSPAGAASDRPNPATTGDPTWLQEATHAVEETLATFAAKYPERVEWMAERKLRVKRERREGDRRE